MYEGNSSRSLAHDINAVSSLRAGTEGMLTRSSRSWTFAGLHPPGRILGKTEDKKTADIISESYACFCSIRCGRPHASQNCKWMLGMTISDNTLLTSEGKVFPVLCLKIFVPPSS